MEGTINPEYASDVTHLLWVDLETTGLDLHQDEVIEVSAFISPVEFDEWTEVDAYPQFNEVYKPSAQALTRMMQNSVIRNMHFSTGLVNECMDIDPRLNNYFGPNFSGWLLKFISRQSKPVKFRIAGSGVATFDYPIIRRHINTELLEYIHYSCFDVGMLRRALNMVAPDITYKEPNPNAHRAKHDIEHHYMEAIHYLDNLSNLKYV